MDNLTPINDKGNTSKRVLPFFKSSQQALLFSLLWMGVILLLTGLPGNSFPKVSKWMDVFQPDKLIHIGMFFPFAWFWQSYFLHKKIRRSTAIIIVSFFGIVYASLTEVLQHSVFIGRSANVPDAIADVIGVVLSILAFNYYLSKRGGK